MHQSVETVGLRHIHLDMQGIQSLAPTFGTWLWDHLRKQSEPIWKLNDALEGEMYEQDSQ